MTLQVTGGYMEVYKPSVDDPAMHEPSVVVPSGDIEAASEDQRADEFKDVGTFRFDNSDGRYAGEITSGDTLRFFANTTGTVGAERRFTAIARNVRYDRQAPNSGAIEIEVEDFVGGVMSMRRVSMTREDRPIVTDGSLDLPNEDLGIINLILKQRCPNIDRTALRPLGATSSLRSREEIVKDVVDGLAARADAVVWGEDYTIHVTPISDLTSAFTVTGADITGSYTYDVVDDNLANDVRIEGGKNDALENEQPTVAAYVSPDYDPPHIAFHYHTRKAETQRISLWTRRDRANANPQDGLKVRLQSANADNTGPVNPEDETSDIVSREISIEFLTNDGWTEFVLGDHTLAERDVWVIVVGEGNVEIGVDANGTPAFRQFYPYPLLVRQVDAASINEFRRREASNIDRSLRTRAEALQAVRSQLTDSARPRETITVEAESERMHALTPADMVTIQRPKDAIDGEFVVTDRRDRFDGVQLRTNLALTEADSL